MTRSQMTEVALYVLVLVAVVVLALGWYAMGLSWKPQSWQRRAYRVLSVIFYLSLFGIVVYLGLMPWREMF